jgi:hypothetical protein
VYVSHGQAPGMSRMLPKIGSGGGRRIRKAARVGCLSAPTPYEDEERGERYKEDKSHKCHESTPDGQT